MILKSDNICVELLFSLKFVKRIRRSFFQIENSVGTLFGSIIGFSHLLKFSQFFQFDIENMRSFYSLDSAFRMRRQYSRLNVFKIYES